MATNEEVTELVLKIARMARAEREKLAIQIDNDSDNVSTRKLAEAIRGLGDYHKESEVMEELKMEKSKESMMELMGLAGDIIGSDNAEELLNSTRDMAKEKGLSEVAMFGGAVMALVMMEKKELLVSGGDLWDYTFTMYNKRFDEQGDLVSYDEWNDLTSAEKEEIVKSAIFE